MRRQLLLSTALIGFAFSPIGVQAAGFYIQEQSASGLGAAFAGQAAMARDASTVFSNPAGMTQLDGAQANIGLHLIQPITDIDDRGSSVPAAFSSVAAGNVNDGDNSFNLLTVPNMSVAFPVEGVLDRPLWVGLTVNNPFGLAIDYGEDFIGRFVGTNAALTTLNISPNVAYEVADGLSLGGGLNFEYANARFEFATPNPFAAGDGLFSLRGHDWEIGANFGLLYEPLDTTKIALTYRTAISHDADTSVDFQNNINVAGADSLSSAKTNVDLPDITQFAVAHDLNDQWTVLGSVTYFGWSKFQDLRIELDDNIATNPTVINENFKDTIAVALGAEYK